jgi:acyl-CoA synthetase (NDP forming)
MSRSGLDALLKPGTIAIVGASDRASSWTQEIHSNLKEFGYPGRIHPVNPRRSTVWGQQAYKSLKDLPGDANADRRDRATRSAGTTDAGR